LAKEHDMKDPRYPCHNYQHQASICIRPRKVQFFKMWKGKYPQFETRPTSQTHTQPTRKALSLQQLNEKESNWWGQEKLVADVPVTKTKKKKKETNLILIEPWCLGDSSLWHFDLRC